MTISAAPIATTVYSASCLAGQCTSGASNTLIVTVLDPKSPTIIASAEQVCPGTSVTLTAAGCEGGIVEWSDKAQTGISIVVTPNGKTTYTAQCRLGSCLSGPTTKIIDITPNLPTPTITVSETVVCPGETVLLTVNNCVGTPIWNSTTATTTSITVTPTGSNNSYYVYCKNGACTSKTSAAYTISIVEPTIPIVTASADAICSQGSVSLTATGCNGTVVWNLAAKNGSPITGPVITVYPQNGNTTSYYAQCKVNTCISGPSNSVTIKLLAPSAPIITTTKTLVCSGEKITLSATGCQGGTVSWYPVNKTGFTVDLYPAATTEYYATCKLGSCESEASNRVRVTVNTGSSPAPVIMASTTTLCGSGLVSLTATGCTAGKVQWSDGQTGTVVSVSATPTNREFYALCKTDNQCGSGKSNVITINTVTSGSTAPTVTVSTSSVCSGEKVTLTANGCQGTIQWYGVNQRGASIDLYPTATQRYYAICTQDNCSSPASNTVTVAVTTSSSPVPVIAASTTAVCGSGLVSLTATGCTGGTIQWSDGQTGTVVSVSVTTANKEFYALCKTVNQCGSSKSNSITITVNPATVPAPMVVASTSLVCSGENVTLTATGCQGTVQWYGINRTGNSLELYPTTTQTYYAICSQGGCSSPASNTLTVNVNTGSSLAPTTTTSTTAICGSGLVSLTATGCTGGTVQWSDGQIGSVVSVSVTPTNKEFYALCKAVGQCGSGRSNLISITVIPILTPTVTCSTDSICPGEQVKLTVQNCQGIPHWSTNETTTSITVSPTATTSYTVYCQEGNCKSNPSSTYTINVMAVAAPTITASATVVTPGTSITLTASGCAGDVVWSANDGNGNNKGPVLVVRPTGTQTYYAQCRFRQCLSNPSTVITVNPVGCFVNAGTLAPVNSTICANSDQNVILSATTNGGMIQPSGYSLVYLLANDGVILKTSAIPSFTVTATTTRYTIHTLIYDAATNSANYVDLSKVTLRVSTVADVQALIQGRCAALDPIGAKIDVNRVDSPRLYAIPSLTVCQGSKVTLGTIGCSGGTVTWSDGSVGETIEKLITGDLWLMASCTLNGCTSQPSKSIDVHITNLPIPIIVSDRSVICIGETVSLTATGCEGGIYTWSDGKTVGPRLTLTPSADISYRVKCTLSNCEGDWSAYTTIKVGTPTSPTISVAGTSSPSVCFGTTITLTAQGCGPDSYVTWSNNQVGNSITITPAGSSTFTARCCTSNQCKSAPSNALAVIVLVKVTQPVVNDLTNTCPMLTVELARAFATSPSTTGGQFEYYSDVVLSTKVVDPTRVGTGTYYVIERTVSGCTSLPVAIHVQITTCSEPTPCMATNPATASAGADASVCAGETYRLGGSMTGAGQTAHWTTSGNGSFDNTYSLSAVYTASLDDVMAGKVTLTLSVSTNNVNCPVAKDEMILSFNGSKTKPVIIVAGGFNLCYGDSITLKAPAGASGYKWSNGKITQNIVVKESGSYSVQLLDGTGCSSVKSDNVSINVNEPVMAPLVHDLRNTCPAKIVDLTKALSMTTTGSTYSYRICECNTSNIVIRPDSVCAGNYWVVTKGANGCVSAPAKIVVNIINCAADTMKADVSISKRASTDLVLNGAPVAYTLTVSNAGPHTARHIQVRDVLPKGLELIPNAGASYNVSNGVISQRIDSLPVGKSTQIIYLAKVAKGQTVINTAEIVYLDNQDANLANNISSVTVSDNTSHQPQPQGASIGLALAVAKVESMSDSSYNVTYKATIKNFGMVDLKGIILTDSLAKSFPSPTSYTVVGIPVIRVGSSLKVNTRYDGKVQQNLLSPLSSLAAGVQDSVLITVNIKPNGNKGPFYSSATVVGHTPDSIQTVMDISNSGFDPSPSGSTSTTVRFDLPEGLLGVAKSVGTPVQVTNGVYDIPYTIALCNLGTVPLKNVQVEDKLSETFGHGALIVSNRIAIAGTGAGTIKIDSNYTGQGMITKMLVDSMSTLAVGGKAYLNFTVRVNVKNADTLVFYNTAMATAMTTGNELVSDLSTAGTNDDPDNDLDPRNNSQPTPIALNSLATSSYLGLAMSVRDTARQTNGSYNITYQIVLKAYGPDVLKNVTVTDSLAQVFGASTGSTYSMVNRPVIVSTGSALKLNPNYNGGSDPVLVLGDSTSRLAAGKADTLLVVVNVASNGSTTTFLNSAYGQAMAKSGRVSDISTSGLNPDLNGNGNPTDSNEREATALSLPPTYLTIFIPEGFSPNGDGVNDLFVVRGVSGLTVSLEVYNRWGHVVYQNSNYQNDWDGKPNTGITPNGNSVGVPDGTYYYVIKVSDGRKFVRYMTINR